MENYQYIVIRGNVVNGFNFVGPFPTYDAAEKWADAKDNIDSNWTITELYEPRG